MEQNKTGKYLKYAIGEIVLVVIGILIALSINNWNEERKTNLEEGKLLTSIKNALISDIDNQFVLHLDNAKGYYDDTKLIMMYLNNSLPYTDSLGLNFSVLSYGAGLNWTPQLTAYMQLEAKGIDIIENDILLENILNIYNLDYPLIETTFENYKRNIYDYGRPLVRRKFKSMSRKVMVPLDYENLLVDVEFYNTVKVLNGNSRSIMNRMLEIKSNVEHVIKLIDDELNIKN